MKGENQAFNLYAAPEENNSEGIDKELYSTRMAENLKLLRAKLNITQKDLCDLIGVSRQTIVQAENSGKLSWCTYLALVFLFSKNKGTEELMKMLDIYPDEVENVINSNIG